MTVSATQPTITVGSFLLGGEPDGGTAALERAFSDRGVLDSCGPQVSRLTQDGRAAAHERLASVIASLLNFDLGDVLIYAWRTHERLVQAATETLAKPGTQAVVQLGSHRITSIHRPTIDLLVDGVCAHTLEFRLAVVFDIDVAAAIVEDGRLVAIKAGDALATGSLAVATPDGDVEIVRQQRNVDLHVIVHVGAELVPRA